MKKILFAILVVNLSLFAADLADVSFSPNWSLDNGATISGDTLTIVSNGSSIIRATLTASVDATTETLYLVGDMHFSSDLVVGDKSYTAPRFKLSNASDNSKINYLSMTNPLLDKWYTNGMMVKRFSNFNASSVKIEVMLQQTSGTMTVTNLRLVDTPPTAIYNFPYPIPADKSCRINLKSTEKREFPSNLLSVNSHFVWADGGWADNGIRDAINNRMPLGNLRFPGGTVGNYYDWQTDGFYNDAYTFASSSRKKAYEDGFRFGFTDYTSLCKESGATSTLMFNVIEDSPTKAAQRLQNRLDAGLSIDVIEMGNENFFSDQASGNVADVDYTASVSAYISHTKAMTTALKAVDPTIKVAVNINRHSWDGEWDTQLANENYYDATVVHPYVNINGFLFGEASAKEYLASYREIQDNLTNYQAVFGTTPMHATEWSVLSDGIPINFLQVLGVGDLLFGLIEGNDRGIVQQLGIHMLYHSDKYSESTLYFKENGVLTRTQLGVFYEKVVSLLMGSSIYSALGKSGEITAGVPGVLARAIVKNDTTKIIVINKLPESSPLNITIDGKAYSDNYSLEAFAEPLVSDLKGYAFDENPWKMSSGTGTPLIPAYSVSVLTLSPDPTAVNGSLVSLAKSVSISQKANQIQLSNTQNFRTVSLYSLNGRKLFSQNIVGNSGQVQVNSANLSMGSYIVQLSGNINFVQKILIK